jgi:hypothetical protein
MAAFFLPEKKPIRFAGSPGGAPNLTGLPGRPYYQINNLLFPAFVNLLYDCRLIFL